MSAPDIGWQLLALDCGCVGREASGPVGWQRWSIPTRLERGQRRTRRREERERKGAWRRGVGLAEEKSRRRRRKRKRKRMKMKRRAMGRPERCSPLSGGCQEGFIDTCVLQDHLSSERINTRPCHRNTHQGLAVESRGQKGKTWESLTRYYATNRGFGSENAGVQVGGEDLKAFGSGRTEATRVGTPMLDMMRSKRAGMPWPVLT
eukprot:436978-Rhodomonas_salina.2